MHRQNRIYPPSPRYPPKWKPKWDMQFNTSKCQVIHITRSRSPIPTEYTLHGESLEVVECARYLGVDIAHDLFWKTHVSRITNNANKSLGYLRRNLRSKIHSTKGKRKQGNCQLDNAASVWDPYNKTVIMKIESVQRRAARWILGDYSPYLSVTDMIGQLWWCTLEQCRTDSRLVLFYKIIYGYVAIHLPSYGIPLIRASRTSHTLAYRQISTGTKYYKYLFYPLRVVQWDSLPVSVATLTDIDSFKRDVCQVCHSKP